MKNGIVLGFIKFISFFKKSTSGFLSYINTAVIYIFTKGYLFLFTLHATIWNKIVLFFLRIGSKTFKFSLFFLVFYLLLYLNLCGFVFNFIYFNFFQGKVDNIIIWNFSNFHSILFLVLSFLDIDNIIIIIYCFFKVGLGNFFYLNWGEWYYLFGLNWVFTYCTYKLDSTTFSFTKLLIDDVLFTIYNSQIDFNNLEFNSTPIFFFFGSLFFLTVIFSWFFFSYLGLYGVFKLNLITIFFFWVSLLLSAKVVLVHQKIYIIKICSWVFLNSNFKIDCYFLIDTISFSFMLLTTTIAFFVLIYAFSYFRYEPLVDRFILFLLSFVISMIFLVVSGNIIMLFLGWELIGFTSFCLINFWTTKTATLKSAFKAFTFNKVSDFFMFMFLVASFNVYYTFDILSLNVQIYKSEPLTIFLMGTDVNFLEFLAIMLIGAAFIKSAQFGGHTWLPDSMEAPVPASSLIHSATLVSAGVYLILRFNFIFDATQYSRFIIPVVGSLTAAYGGVCAVAQSDIKKTLAYSTISHCGFLMVLCATEMNEFTILYLYVHGFFKAGVFMCVGNILRITRGYQDTRRMGGLLKYLPFEYFCATVGLLNLAGLPFTFGFFIKHLLLISLEKHICIYYFVMFNSLVGAFAGLFYSYRILTYTFCDFKKGHKVTYLNLNRSCYNSFFYTTSSVAATISIFGLFLFSYTITYFLFKFFLDGNFLFSDYMNTTTLSNYYSVINSFNGYLLNFSYINLTVVVLVITLFFSKYRLQPRSFLFKKLLFSLLLSSAFLFYFINII